MSDSSNFLCPTGLPIVLDDDGNYVPFFIKTRDNDIIWNNSNTAFIEQFMRDNNITDKIEVLPTKSYKFTNIQSGWTVTINSDMTTTLQKEIPLSSFTISNNKGVMDIVLPLDISYTDISICSSVISSILSDRSMISVNYAIDQTTANISKIQALISKSSDSDNFNYKRLSITITGVIMNNLLYNYSFSGEEYDIPEIVKNTDSAGIVNSDKPDGYTLTLFDRVLSDYNDSEVDESDYPFYTVSVNKNIKYVKITNTYDEHVVNIKQTGPGDITMYYHIYLSQTSDMVLKYDDNTSSLVVNSGNNIDPYTLSISNDENGNYLITFDPFNSMIGKESNSIGVSACIKNMNIMITTDTEDPVSVTQNK